MADVFFSLVSGTNRRSFCKNSSARYLSSGQRTNNGAQQWSAHGQRERSESSGALLPVQRSRLTPARFLLLLGRTLLLRNHCGGGGGRLVVSRASALGVAGAS